MSHPNKDIRRAINHAIDNAWTLQKLNGRGHTWGILWCSIHFCRMNVYCTPKNPTNHAKTIRQAVRRCPHDEDEE